MNFYIYREREAKVIISFIRKHKSHLCTKNVKDEQKDNVAKWVTKDFPNGPKENVYELSHWMKYIRDVIMLVTIIKINKRINKNPMSEIKLAIYFNYHDSNSSLMLEMIQLEKFFFQTKKKSLEDNVKIAIEFNNFVSFL